jgi:uncharacterized protein
MKLRISYQGEKIFEDIRMADTLTSRLIGLMFQATPPGEGLLLDPCRSIHTFFMKYPLDIVFLDRQNKMVKIIRHLAPWRMTWIYFRAVKTLEVPAGRLPPHVREGDELEVQIV